MLEPAGSTGRNTLEATGDSSRGARTASSVDVKATECICSEILRLRLSQLIVNEQYKAGRFKVPIHLAMGHESIAVSVSSVMSGNDKLLLSHRNIGNLVQKKRSAVSQLNLAGPRFGGSGECASFAAKEF